ncbi:MAG: hypothetical protein AB1779_04800 [Candidatus Thermoplasmatota archaeon]
MLDKLKIPYYPIIGNHDIWAFNDTFEEAKPTGDKGFMQIFGLML